MLHPMMIGQGMATLAAGGAGQEMCLCPAIGAEVAGIAKDVATGNAAWGQRKVDDRTPHLTQIRNKVHHHQSVKHCTLRDKRYGNAR